jgi:hypothetical protein
MTLQNPGRDHPRLAGLAAVVIIMAWACTVFVMLSQIP